MIAPFGITKAGHNVDRLTISNDALSVSVLTLGAILHDVRFLGSPRSLTLGFDSVEPYEGDHFHVGSIVGPVANRITNARAEIDGMVHEFERNIQDRHTLHSGAGGLHSRVWDVVAHNETSLRLGISLSDGDGGFPGNRRIEARFTLEGASLTLDLTTQTDKTTIVNIANHSYWNLGPNPTTKGHELTVAADRFTPTDPVSMIPTGEVLDVEGTRFDFREGRVLNDGGEGLLDLNLCLSDAQTPSRQVATLTGPTGVSMSVSTTAPGMQVFDGHILGDPPAALTDGTKSVAYGGVALETQFWPDAMANPHFPSIVLSPNDEWKQSTRWSFTRNQA